MWPFSLKRGFSGGGRGLRYLHLILAPRPCPRQGVEERSDAAEHGVIVQIAERVLLCGRLEHRLVVCLDEGRSLKRVVDISQLWQDRI